jgi:hypothetical protein
MRGEQDFQSLAQGAVSSADGLKEGRPLGDGLLKRQREQGGLSFLG